MILILGFCSLKAAMIGSQLDASANPPTLKDQRLSSTAPLELPPVSPPGAGIHCYPGSRCRRRPAPESYRRRAGAQEVSSCSLFFLLIFDKFFFPGHLVRCVDCIIPRVFCQYAFRRKFYFSKNSANFFHVLQYAVKCACPKVPPPRPPLVSALPCTSLRHTSWNSTSIR